jgi:hypothetical protein
MDKPVKPEPKKPYSPPKVTVYGTVRELTLHQGTRGKRDSPPRHPGHNRTNV